MKFMLINFLRWLYDISPYLIGPKKQTVLQIKNIQLDNGIKIRIYTPIEGKHLPVLIFYHGGGWIIGSINAYDRILRYLSHFSKCLVIAVEYRKAPEHKFPVAITDACNACVWVMDNIVFLGGDKNRVGLIGDSAGGNIAAHVAARTGVQFNYMVLIYPVIDVSGKTLTRLKAQSNWFLKYGYMVLKFCLRQYLSNEDDAVRMTIPKTCIPKTLILAAGTDILLPTIESYVKQMQATKANITYKCYTQASHGFLNYAGISKLSIKALRYIIHFIKDANKIGITNLR